MEKPHNHMLVQHDGMRDSLTGLLSIPAFLEFATRELVTAQRVGENAHIGLISLRKGNSSNEELLYNVAQENLEQNEKLRDEISARIVESSHVLREIFRSNDVICRYTFSDFLLLHVGNGPSIREKYGDLSIKLGALYSLRKSEYPYLPSKSDTEQVKKIPSISEHLLGIITLLESDLLARAKAL